MKNTYTPDALVKLEQGFEDSLTEARDMLTEVVVLGGALKSPRAREYLNHGVGRRLRLVQRCVINIYDICPLDRSELFDRDELQDLNINLHAFLLNVYGILDDLAWVVALEATQKEVQQRRDISLYGPEVQKHLPPETAAFLQTMKPWHDNYMKNFRDSLAHRIPAYVPPMRLADDEAKRSEELDKEILEAIKKHDFGRVDALKQEERKLGKLMPVYTHSFGDPDASAPVYLHSQVIVDLKTIVAIIRSVADALRKRRGSP
jgi:hypothetical protein